MSKTPVSLLQELMIKRNVVPNYELLSNSEGIGTHNPTFLYKVTADMVQAIGKGRSKKEAKHEAAKLALEKLSDLGFGHTVPNIPSSPIQSSTPDPNSPQKIQVNAIGALSDFCAEKHIPLPTYTLISDVGPAHLRMFTIECKVATMTITATDLTKKKARQNAAQKMLHRLVDTLPEVIEEMTLITNDCVDLKAIESNDSVIKAYNELSTFNKKRTNWGMKISDYPKVIKDIMEEKELSFDNLWKGDNTLNNLRSVLDKLDLHLCEELIEQETNFLAFLMLDSDPDFIVAESGESEAEALSSVYRQVLEFIKIMTR